MLGLADVSGDGMTTTIHHALTAARIHSMATHLSAYVPSSCEFHDLLEILATTRPLPQVRFRDAEGLVQQRSATITDVYAHEAAEWGPAKPCAWINGWQSTTNV
jgi:hypothetical protein